MHELLRRWRVNGSVVMGPADIAAVGSIGPEQWAIIAPLRFLRLIPEREPAVVIDGGEPKAVSVFPKHAVVVPAQSAWWVLTALEETEFSARFTGPPPLT